MAFVAYALFILLLGKSTIAIRLAGTFCVFLTSWFIYLIGNRLGNNNAIILAGVLSIIAASTMTGGGQATLTEHVAVVPFFAELEARPHIIPVGKVLYCSLLPKPFKQTYNPKIRQFLFSVALLIFQIAI